MAGEKAPIIKCRGCGQVGAIVPDRKDEFGGRQRRHGFYLHGGSGGARVVACCKCQQIQSFDGGPAFPEE